MNSTPSSVPAPFKMLCTGLGLNSPVDAMAPGKFPILGNVQVLESGQLDARGGSGTLNSTVLPSVPNSLRRLNDPNLDVFTRLIGAGTFLYSDEGTGTFTSIDTGYSGNPLSQVPFRPTNSVSPWMYIGDKSRMRKVRADNLNYLMGIQAPLTAPVTGLSDPYLDIIADFGTGEGFATSGTASSRTNPARFSDTISVIIYDGGTNGNCTVIPSGAINDNYQVGALISLSQGSNNDQDPIHDVFQAIPATTISAIIYDTGTSGLCSVTLTAPASGLVPRAIIALNTEKVQILSVINGVDGVPSIRCSTTGTHSTGETVTGYNSFRIYTNAAYTSGATLGGSITACSITAGIGVITATLSENLAIIGGTQPTSSDDVIHCSILFDVPGNVTQGWLEIDTSDGSFSGNYYSYNFSANQLAPALTGSSTVTAAQTVTVQQQIISDAATGDNTDNGGENTDSTDTTGFIVQPIGANPSQAITLGVSQWTELFFTVNDLIPVGSSEINSLATVAAVRVRVQVVGTVNLYASSWWIGGGFGPDTGATGSPAIYVYRYRASATGALSNPSPYSLNGLMPNRERILVDCVCSVDPQVDQIDVFRFGIGKDQWTYLGSIPNTSGTVRFFDVYDSLSIANNEIADFDNYVPFPVSDVPRSGTCTTSGISVKWVSGDNFNVNWVPGSQIIINNVPYELYGQPSSTAFLQLAESAGASTSPVKWFMPSPTITGNPLPFMWGFGGQGIGTYLFGVGDAYNPGFLRWTKGNNPDTASDTGNLEITSPSEPLINGFEYDSRCFVFSSSRLFSVLPNLGGGTGSNTFTAQVVMTGKGLYAPYSICVTPVGVAWVSVDGVYVWSGGSVTCISDADLYPIFPHGSSPGVSVNGYYPPDYTKPNNMRLGYASSSIYFTYTDTNNNNQCLRYDTRLSGWFPETYPTPPVLVYQEEGESVESTLLVCTDGRIRIIGINGYGSDSGTPILCRFRTPSLEHGQSRAQKLYTDFMIDANAQSATFTYTLYFDNWANTQVAGTSDGSIRGQVSLSTSPTTVNLHVNIALDVTWAGLGTFYEFQPWYIIQPHLALQHFAQNVNFGNYSHVRDGWIGYISTAQITLTITVDGVAYPYTVPSSNGAYIRIYMVFGLLKGLLLGFNAQSTSPFVLFAGDTIVNLKPWSYDGPYQQYKPFGGMIEA